MTATTTTTLEKVGARLYLAGLPFAAKDRAKQELGCKWDGDRRQWWVGAAKRAAAEALVADLNGGSASRPTDGSREVAAGLGLDPDAPSGIVADYLQDQGRDREADRIRRGLTAVEDPHDIRLTGKGRYKGREYYAGAVSGGKVRLLTLPDADGKYLDFRADCSLVEQTKTYEAREVWDGRRYSGRTVTRHTTLGSIADFIARQKRDKGTGRERVQCHECDSWHDAAERCPDCGGC